MGNAIASKTKWDQENRALEEIRKDRAEILEFMKFESNPEIRLQYAKMLEKLDNSVPIEVRKSKYKEGGAYGRASFGYDGDGASFGGASFGGEKYGGASFGGASFSGRASFGGNESELKKEAKHIIHSGMGAIITNPNVSDEDKKEMLKAHGLWTHIVDRIF